MRGDLDALVVPGDPRPRVVPAAAAKAAGQAPSAPTSDPVVAVARIAGVLASSSGSVDVCVALLTSTAVPGIGGRVSPRASVARYCKGMTFLFSGRKSGDLNGCCFERVDVVRCVKGGKKNVLF